MHSSFPKHDCVMVRENEQDRKSFFRVLKDNKRFRFMLAGPVFGVMYYAFIQFTGLSFICPFRKITGWLCPGCGTTTMILHLGRFEFAKAFACNPLLMLMGPFFVYAYMQNMVLAFKVEQKPDKWNKLKMCVVALLLLGYGILRNVL